MTLIFWPPGITTSPGFWSGLQAPSHFASMRFVIVRDPWALASVWICDTVATV
jgi:hypothetical protein